MRSAVEGARVGETPGIVVQAVGDTTTGYSTVISYNRKPIARHNGGGEFSAVFQTSDRLVDSVVSNWKGTAVAQKGNTLTLSGPLRLPESGSRLDVAVSYEVVNAHVVRKRIALTQLSGPKLLYRLCNRLEPTRRPDSYWSFEKASHPGGSLYEVFPAAGFRYGDVAVGLLTDSGARNLWGRMAQRLHLTRAADPKPSRQHDSELVQISGVNGATGDDGYVEMNFGEMKDYSSGLTSPIGLPSSESWIPVNGGRVSATGANAFMVSGPVLAGGRSGVSIPVGLRQKEQCRLRFRYRSASPIAVRIWNDAPTDVQTSDPPVVTDGPDGWKTFDQSFFLLYPLTKLNDRMYVFIGKDTPSQEPYSIEIADLRLDECLPAVQSYHPLDSSKASQKTLFIFADECPSQREVQIACQEKLAEGLGFNGSMADKIFVATSQMLTWIAEPSDLTPHVVPSMNYNPWMFMRDTFWNVASMDDKYVSEAVWNRFARSVGDQGRVETNIVPYATFDNHGGEDSTLYFVILGYVNKQRYGTKVDTSVVQRCLDGIRRNVVDGKYRAFTPGWIDVIAMNQPAEFAPNQGLYVNALRCARKLGCNVTDSEIKAADKAYRDLYDPKLGYVAFAENLPELVAPTCLMGEFLSWWLWNKPILPTAAVIGTLDKLPVIKDCVPCLMKGNGEFLSDKDDPITPLGGYVWDSKHMPWNGGTYLNGGGWLLYEYMAYVAGLKHGWPNAEERMRLRLNAEFNMNPEEPVSHEWLPLGVDSTFSPTARVYGWNCFVRIAEQVAKRGKSGQYRP